MAFRVDVQLAALDDIEDFARFVAKRGNPERAANWRDQVLDAIGDLATSAASGLLIPEARRLKRDYRQIHVHSHRVVYFVDDDAQTVVVARVYHGARRALRTGDLE